MKLDDLITLIEKTTGCDAIASTEHYLPLDLHLQRLQLPNNEEGKVVYFAEGENLLGLNLAGVGLEESQVDIILKHERCHTLRSLNLHQNQLTNWFFPNQLSELEYLELSENQALQQITFQKGLPKLKRLDLSECALTELDLPDGFGQLVFLDANYNKNLTNISFSASFPELQYIYLAACSLRTISFEQSMPQLRYLFANENQIQQLRVSQGVFFPQIESLYLKQKPVQRDQTQLADTFCGESFPRT